MEKFKNLKSIPAYLSLMNIDTDMIIPKQFLKTIKRTGLGKSLFFEMRYDQQGKEISSFVLNKKPCIFVCAHLPGPVESIKTIKNLFKNITQFVLNLIYSSYTT